MLSEVAADGNAARSCCWCCGLTGAPPIASTRMLERSRPELAARSATRGPVLPSAGHIVTRSDSISRSTSSASKRPERSTSVPPFARKPTAKP